MARGAASVIVSIVAVAMAGLPGGCATPPGPMAGGPSGAWPLSEVRLGALGHDVVGPGSERGGADLSAEALFVKPWTSTDPFLNALLPRPDIGGTADFSGRTSEAYAGVAWDYDLTSRIFVESGLGGSVNDGRTEKNVAGHLALGSNVLFRESASLGYRLTPNWSVMATVEHMSNAGFCDENRGLTNAGARIGYAF